LVLGEEDVSSMSNMSEAVKVVAVAITNATPPDVNHEVYSAVMDATRFSAEAKMVALSHLFDSRALGNGFVHMAEDHRQL
jgi:hypothetical protein